MAGFGDGGGDVKGIGVWEVCVYVTMYVVPMTIFQEHRQPKKVK